jgi:hypothetical protein
MRPIGTIPPTVCWHCSQPIDFAAGEPTARYLYRGDQPLTVVIEDWMHCACGAYQNVRRLNEISVEALGNS